MYNASSAANPATPTSPSTPGSTPASNGPPAAATASQQETPTQPPSTPQTQTPTPAPAAPQPQPKKNLSLTVSRVRPHRSANGRRGVNVCVCAPQRDQMYAAQEMFKTANKVTRPEKALILGFMAGSRGKTAQIKKRHSIFSIATIDEAASCVHALQRTLAPSRVTSSRSSWASTRRCCLKRTAQAARPCWWTLCLKWTTPQDSGLASRNTNPSPTPPEDAPHLTPAILSEKAFISLPSAGSSFSLHCKKKKEGLVFFPESLFWSSFLKSPLVTQLVVRGKRAPLAPGLCTVPVQACDVSWLKKKKSMNEY